jgi:Spy/CpxP family protein refolding chaperone
MNRRMVFVSAFAAVLMMALVAFGQEGKEGKRPGGAGGFGGRMGMMGSARILRAEAVQKELNITADQLTKLKEVLEATRGPGGNRDMTEEERTKMMEEMAKRTAEQEKKIAEVLNEKQVARLKQIRLQATGVMAIMGEELSKELSVTAEQKEKIQGAMREIRAATRDAGAGGFAQMGEKMNAKVMEILTAEQKTKYKELCGAPFDVAQLRMGGPGGGQRRGGGN